MAENTSGRNQVFVIKNADDTPFHDLVLHKATYDSVVMSLGDKITGDVYYKDTSLAVTMKEYIEYNNVRYILVNPPTIVREGMAANNSELKGMTKYSFTFYHPMCLLGNFPFSDVAVGGETYLSHNKTFAWIGTLADFVAKINSNLIGTEWVCEIGNTVQQVDINKMSDVMSFDKNSIADALKTGYETWEIPYIIDSVSSSDSRYAQDKRFLIRYGLPSEEILDTNNQPYVFRYGKGVGLKNNSRTPRNNKIVTRIVGYGSENNIPYGYPQIVWNGSINDSRLRYPLYDGIVNGQWAKLIKHPFTRKHLMPSVYTDAVNKKVNPEASGYNPNIELVDYYDAVSSGGTVYPNPINPNAPSVEIHEFDIKPELENMSLIGVHAYEQKYDDAIWPSKCIAKLIEYKSESDNYVERQQLDTIIEFLEDEDAQQAKRKSSVGSYSYEWSITTDTTYAYIDYKSSILNFSFIVIRAEYQPYPEWDDTMDEEGNYRQSYFRITLPVLSFDLYACASITEQMSINMRSGACKGCTFPVMIDWDDYKRNFYDSDGNFDPAIGGNHPRNSYKYPDSRTEQITVIVQKEYQTFGVLMPNTFQRPYSGDQFVILGISLPQSYITSAEQRLDNEMKQYMLDNNVYYFDYPLNFDAHFLATHTSILSQIKPNVVVRFEYNNETIALYVKQMSIKWGQSPLPQYDIVLTDDVEIVLNPIGKVTDDVSKLRIGVESGALIDFDSLAAKLDERYDQRYLSKTDDDTDWGTVRLLKGLQVGEQYVSGLLGRGGVFRNNDDGTTYLEVDKMYVRMRAYFDTLEIRRFIHSGGNRIASLAGIKCSRVEYRDANGDITNDLEETVKFRCYFRAVDNGNAVTNDFLIGDLAFCKETNASVGAGVEQHGYWRAIVGVSSAPENDEHYIDLSKDDCLEDSGIPQAQDDIIQLGNKTDTTRQGAIIEYVGGENAPSYQIYQGINDYSLVSKNYVRFGYNSQSHSAEAYIGNPDGSSYIWYHNVTQGGVTHPQLDIKAVINAQSNIGDKTLEQYIQDAYDVSEIWEAIGELQSQIDGEIDTWYYEGVPTLNNAPAVNWTTDSDKNNHLGDLYYNKTDGSAYRFVFDEDDNTYKWVEIHDDAMSEALRIANEAKDTADGKRRVFLTDAQHPHPNPPYDEGDLWVNAVWPAAGQQGQGSLYNDEILRCNFARESGSFSINDWGRASNKFENWVTNEYADTIQAIGTQVDKKAETWYQPENPATTAPPKGWYGTTETNEQHVGDIWYCTQDISGTDFKKDTTWRYTDKGQNANPRYVWEQQYVPQSVFDAIDGKNAIYTAWGDWGDSLQERDLLIPAADIPASPQTGNVAYKANKVYRCTNVGNPSTPPTFVEISYTDDTVFNNYIHQILNGTDGTSDSSIVAQALHAIKEALLENTTIDGGLILTNLVAMRSGNKVWAGISGQYKTQETGSGWKGHGIAAWYGGGMADWEVYKETHPTETISDTFAKSLFRFDGSGYLAGGNITWDSQGRVAIKDITTLIGGNDTDVLNALATFNSAFHFNTQQGTGTILSIVPQMPFASLQILENGTANNVATQKWVDNNYVSIEFFNRLFQAYKSTTISDSNKVLPNDVQTTINNLKIMVGTWTQQYMSALGLNDSGSSGGAQVLDDLLDVTISNPTQGQVLKYRVVNGVGGWYNAADESGVGTVTQVKVGNTAYNPTNGVVSLPAYPTTLPASDVPSWAKQNQKPSYTLDEVTDGSTRKLSNYLPLAGGTMTGQIVAEMGNRWVRARDYAVIRSIKASGDSYCPVFSAKTASGDWSIGVKTNDERLVASYATDANYGSDSNVTTKIYFPTSDGTLALLTDNVASATKLSDDTAYSAWGQIFFTGGKPKTISSDSKLYLHKPNANNDTGAVYLVYDDNNGGIHLVGGGLYADTYVSALGLSDSGSDVFDETAMWQALGRSGNEQIHKDHIANALVPYALKTDIPQLRTLTFTDDNGNAVATYNGSADVSVTLLTTHNHDDRYVTMLGVSGYYLTWTKNGSVNNLTVPYATHATRLAQSDLANGASVGGFVHSSDLIYVAKGGGNGCTDIPDSVGSFGLMSFKTASGYYGQMLLSSGGTLYVRASSTLQGVAWKKILDSSNWTSTINLASLGAASDTRVSTLEGYFTNGVANNADKLDGKHLNELFTALTSTNDTNLSVTVGGVTKSISGLYALRMKGVKVLEDNSYGDLNLLDGTSYSVITNYNSNDRWLNAPNVSSYWGGAVVFRGEDASLMGQLMWNARHNEDNFPTRYLWWRARANTGWKNDWRSIALGDTDGNIYMLTSASGTNVNSDSAKLKFNSLTIDGFDVTVGQTVVKGAYRSPYIQAIATDSYGRKRLSVFQSNAANYTDPFNEVFTILPNGTVGINPPVTGANTNYNLDVNGYTKTFRLYLSDTIYLTVENGGVHVVGGGLYADTYVSALGLSDDGGDAFDVDAMWQALGTGGNEQIHKDHLTTALSGYAQTSQIPTSLKNPYKLTITVNGTDTEYDGSVAQRLTINTTEGAVTQIKLGTVAYNPTSGVVTLPAYPTTLPASDVSAWAKASTKPTYAFSEITGKATAAQVPNIESLTNFSTRVYDATVTRTKNTILAAPNGSNGAATFRALVAADIPSLSGTYVTLTGAQTISGTKTFSVQQAFTIATGTSPFTVNSTTRVANLNADLLDGAHGTEFYSLSVNNTTAITSGDDLNDYTTPGTYRTSGGNTGSSVASSLLNKPSFAGGFRMYVTSLNPDNTYISQRIISYAGRVFDRVSGSINTDAPWENQAWRELAYTDSNVASATKLQTGRYLWGQLFDGTADVSGNMTGVGSIDASGNITITHTGTTASRFIAINGIGTVELMAAQENRGVYDRTGNVWLIGTNGTNTFLSKGNVGIGKSNPSYALDVNGTAQAATLRATDIYIGGIHITADNNGIHINSAGLYADTYVSALGLSDSSDPAFDESAMWQALDRNSNEQINGSHLTNVLAPYALTSQIPTSLPNPYALNITVNGTLTTYNGSVTRNITIDTGLDESELISYLTNKTLTLKDAQNRSIGSWTPTAAGSISIDLSVLRNLYTSRPTTGNVEFADGGLRTFKATSSMADADGRPNHDAHILHFAWDNSGGWDAQLALFTSGQGMMYRGMNNHTWSAWKTVLDSSNSGITGNTVKINGTSLNVWSQDNFTPTDYVTLAGSQTISGVKTFTTQQKFTVAQGTSPFTVTSTTKVANLNADLLDGFTAADFLNRYTSSKELTGAGWYRVAQISSYGGTILLSLGAIFNHGVQVPHTMILSVSYYSSSIKQLGRGCKDSSGNPTVGHISNVRLVKYGTGRYYVDVYYNKSDSNTEYLSIGWLSRYTSTQITLIDWTPVESLASGETESWNEELTYLFKADGFQTSRTLWGRPFDGTADVSGDMTGVGSFTSSGTFNVTGSSSSYSQGIRIHDVGTGCSIFFGCTENTGVNATMFGITRTQSTGLRFRGPATAEATTLNDYMIIGYGGNIGIGTTPSAYKLDVNGRAKVTSLTIGNIEIVADAQNGGLRIMNAGLYADTYLSALGIGQEGGGSGTDLESVWASMREVVTGSSNHTIDISHFRSALSTYLLENGYATQTWVGIQNYATQAWVNQQGFIKNAGVTSISMSLPEGLRVNGLISDTVTTTGTFAVTFENGYSIPTDVQQASWDAKQNAINDLATIRANASDGEIAYSWGNHATIGYALASHIYDSTTSRTKNTVLAAPNGSNGLATFRALVAADIPNLDASKITTGTISSSRLPDLSGTYATPSSVASQMQSYSYISSGVIHIGDSVITPLVSDSGTFWGRSWTSGGTVSGDMSDVGDISFNASGKNIGGLLYFNTTSSQLRVASNATVSSFTHGSTTVIPKLYVAGELGTSAGLWAGFAELYYSTPYIDFHFANNTGDYTTRIIESAAGTLAVSAFTGNTVLKVGSVDGDYLQVGQVRIAYDSGNNALKVVGSNGTSAANFYALGGVSALGYSQTSDIRKKDFIRNIDIDVEAIAHAPLFLFTWKDKSIDTLTHLGTSAQYWQDVAAQTVTADGAGMLGLDYGVAALGSVTCVARKVMTHEEEIAAVKRRLSDVEAENERLKNEIEQLKAA